VVKRKFVYIGFFLALFFVVAPKAFSLITTFDATTGGSVGFTGNYTKFLQIQNSSGINMSDNNFTISWWQKTTSLQYHYPRILQFGHGDNYTDGFAISEEDDGNIYLWINGINITSMAIPATFSWDHITVERNGYDYSWFLNGTFVSTTHFEYVIPDGGLSKFANFNTTGLDLLIGAGDNLATGAFNGQIAGLQISQSAKWDTNTVFAPPTDFLNPGAGFAFSMYVNESDVLDKSGNNLTVVPIVITAGEFSDFNPPVSSTPSPSPSASSSGSPSASPSPSPSDSSSPSPSPSDSPSDSPSPSPSPSDPAPTEEWQVDAEFMGWNNDFDIYKAVGSQSYDFSQIQDVAVGVPVHYLDSDGVPVKTRCYVQIPWEILNSGERIELRLMEFSVFQSLIFPSDCQTAPDMNHPSGPTIPNYETGMFGNSQTKVDFVFWTTPVFDHSDLQNAEKRLFVDLNIPPEITSSTILRGDNQESDPNWISFGDSITVTVANAMATDEVVMYFQVPEARMPDGPNGQDHWCKWRFVADGNGEFERTFALPDIDELLDECSGIYTGTWDFDPYAERYFIFRFNDSSNNSSNPIELNLRPLINVDWGNFPTEVGIDLPLWDTTYWLSKAQNAPQFDYHRVKHVSLGIPVTYTASSSAVVNTFCYVLLPSESVEVNQYGELVVDVPGFDVITQFLNSGCSTPHGLSHPSGYEIPDYHYGMLGETQTALTFYLWLEDTEPDFAHPENAFEAVTQNIYLPPEVLSYTITRGGYSEVDPEKIYVGDTLNLNLRRGEALVGLGIRIYIREAFYAGYAPSDADFCWLEIPPDANGNFPDTYTIPSKSEISRICHERLNGDWSYDDTANRYLTLDAVDSEGNGFTKVGPLLMASVPAPTPPAPTPPAPTPPAPTPPAPTPTAPEPVVTILEVKQEVIVDPVPVIEQVIEVVNNVAKEPIKSEVTPVAKPIKSEVKAKQCLSKGVWVFTKSGLLQICDAKLKVVLAVKTCTGKSSTPTYPWVFKAQRFIPGYMPTKSGQKLYYSVFFFKGLAIAGVDKVASVPCSNGSVLVEKKYAKQIYDFIKKNKPLIWVRER